MEITEISFDVFPRDIKTLILEQTKPNDLSSTSLVCLEFNQLLRKKKKSIIQLNRLKYCRPFFPMKIREQIIKEENQKYRYYDTIFVFQNGKGL